MSLENTSPAIFLGVSARVVRFSYDTTFTSSPYIHRSKACDCAGFTIREGNCISYYFTPFEGVGAKRVAYWMKNISKIDKNIKCDVITAIEQKDFSENIVYVENNCTSFLSRIIKDEGATWNKCLKEYFTNIDLDTYDIVLISGGPFMHFGIAKYIKQNSNAKVILDFRDPFYANPRFKSSFIKDSIKKYFQNQFLKYADLVITVNKYCADLIDFKNIRLIDNGFDENITINNLQCKSDDNFVNLIAIGRIDNDFNLKNLFEVLKQNNSWKFNYVGNHIFDERTIVNDLGMKNYENTLACVNESDIAVLFTGGQEFESTTKIFDYLALNKKILIITEGNIKSGALHDITSKYPNIQWSENNKHDIKLNIKTLMNSKLVKFDTSIYSRKNGLEKLVDEFKEIL